MKKKSISLKIFLLMLVFAAAFSVTGFKAEAAVPAKAPVVRRTVVKTPVLKIRKSKQKKELKKGKWWRVPVYLKNVTRSQLAWKSSNPRVARVTQNGMVKGRKIGKAKITAWVRGTRIKVVCKVEVVNFKVYRVRATAYCNCSSCSGPGYPRTASGRYPQQGRTLAVDRRLIPLGTKIVMNGHTYYAEDTGGAIKGKKIDVYFRRHSATSRWGVRYVKIKVYYNK